MKNSCSGSQETYPTKAIRITSWILHCNQPLLAKGTPWKGAHPALKWHKKHIITHAHTMHTHTPANAHTQAHSHTLTHKHRHSHRTRSCKVYTLHERTGGLACFTRRVSRGLSIPAFSPSFLFSQEKIEASYRRIGLQWR